MQSNNGSMNEVSVYGSLFVSLAIKLHKDMRICNHFEVW